MLDKIVGNIICHVKPGHNLNTECKIVTLALALHKDTIQRFHTMMVHPGESHLHAILQECYHHHKLRHTTDRFKCDPCQWHKLPEHKLRNIPLIDVTINLVGPWIVKVNG